MMHMTFYWGRSATILFTDWKTTTWASYSLSLVALFVLSVFHEYLSSRRTAWAAGSSKKSDAEVPLLGKISPRAGRKLLGSGLFGLHVGLAYLLMLAVMCFNGGVFIAVILGFAVGHYFFKNDAVQATASDSEPCGCM